MSVTDTNCLPGETIKSGNSLADLEARAAQALGVTTPENTAAETISKRNDVERGRRRLKHRAQKDADVCGKCGRDLGPEASIYIAVV